MWIRDSKYVPNTRQHATDITKQLYITGEITVGKEKYLGEEEEAKRKQNCSFIASFSLTSFITVLSL